MNIPQKYYRYFIIEGKFRMTLLVFLLIGCGLLLQVQMIKNKQAQLAEEMARQQFASKLPQMEAKLREFIKKLEAQNAKAQAPAASPVLFGPEPVSEPTFEELNILKGIINMDGVYFAVINDNQYKAGDVYKEHLIMEIGSNYAKFMDIKTQEIKVLKLE